jgi:predicted TIM-barrel fold metal-dependent hydrolase
VRRWFGVVAFAAIALVVLALLWPMQPSVAPSALAPASSARGPFVPRRIPKLDVHTHVDADVMGDAVGFLRAHGIGRAINLSGGRAGEDLEMNLAAARSVGGYFVTFCNPSFEGIGEPGWAEREIAELERAKKLGAKGVKIFKSLGLRVRFPDGRRVAVDDPVLDPLFDAMGRLGMPLAIHTGDPKAFFDPPTPDNERWDELAEHPRWSFADRSLYPSWEQLYGEFERRVARSSRTTIIGVHFGNAPEDPARVGRMLDKYPNLYIDTAARIPEIGRKPRETRQVILSHPDRVLFGTDVQIGAGELVLGAGPPAGHSREDVERFFTSSFRFFETADTKFAHPTPIQGRWTIDGIDLPDDVLEKVYHQNAERLLGLEPTPL